MHASTEIKHLPEMSFREKHMQNGYMTCINYIAKSRERLSVSTNQGMRQLTFNTKIFVLLGLNAIALNNWKIIYHSVVFQ